MQPATIDPTVHARRWKTLAVLALSLVIIGLDNTILNVALPTLQQEFDASSSTLQWMVDSYLLVFAGLLLVFGTLGDRFGRKLALQSGVTIFGLASLGALIADTANEVILIRALMGVGAALIMPATLSIIANVFPPEERGKAIGIWAALAAIGIGLGPLAGGLLIEWFDWSAVFLVNVPVALVAVLLGLWLVPESRDPKPGSFDVAGAALSTAGFSVLVYAVIEAPGAGLEQRTDPRPAGRGGRAARRVRVVGAPRGAADARPWLLPQRPLQRRHARGQRGVLLSPRWHLRADPVPAVRPRLLGHRGRRRHDPARARPDHGRRLIEPGRSSGSGSRRVVAAGLTGLAIVLATTLLWDTDTGLLALLPWVFFLALSMGWVMAPATEAVVSAVPAAKSGVASAMNTVARMVSGALGVAVVGSLVNSLYANDVEPALSGLPAPAREAAGESIGAANAVAAELPPEAGVDPAHQRRRRVRRRHGNRARRRRRAERRRRRDRRARAVPQARRARPSGPGEHGASGVTTDALSRNPQPREALRSHPRRRRAELRRRGRHHHRLPRPERLGQDDDAARAARPAGADRPAARRSADSRTARSPRRCGEVGAMLEAAAHPARSARSHLRSSPPRRASRAARVDELLALVELDAAADRRVGGFSLGMRQRLGLAGALIGDPGAARPRRALERARSGRHPVAAGLPALARRRRAHDPAVQPRARRGRPDRRRRRGHQPREGGRARAARRAHARARAAHPRAIRRSPTRSSPRCATEAAWTHAHRDRDADHRQPARPSTLSRSSPSTTESSSTRSPPRRRASRTPSSTLTPDATPRRRSDDRSAPRPGSPAPHAAQHLRRGRRPRRPRRPDHRDHDAARPAHPTSARQSQLREPLVASAGIMVAVVMAIFAATRVAGEYRHATDRAADARGSAAAHGSSSAALLVHGDVRGAGEPRGLRRRRGDHRVRR